MDIAPDRPRGIFLTAEWRHLVMLNYPVDVPFPFHRNFEEVNLRFYVRRWTSEGWRRGVVFVREIVPRRAIATLARLQRAARKPARLA